MKELKNLAQCFKNNNSTLYVVGGFVRDKLLGIESFDYDITSNLNFETTLKIFKDSGFEIENTNLKLGTCKISKNNTNFDYATFRKESYKNNGSHNPTKVKFIKCIKTDAKRRDFTINSIYYDILKEKYKFFFGAKKHLKQGIIKSIKNPNLCFSEDALRIYRLARFCAELNFKPDSKTLEGALANRHFIPNINKNTLARELDKMPKNIKESKIWQLLQL